MRVIAVMSMVLGMLFVSAPAQAQLPCPVGIKAMAHRGLHSPESPTIPETSKASIEGAHNQCAHVEGDVHLSSDGVAVWHHDGTLGRMTTCDWAIREHTWAEIGTCEYANGQPVLNFSQVVGIVSENPGQLLAVEVKGSGWFANNNNEIKQLANTSSPIQSRTFYSEDATIRTLEAFRDSAPWAHTMWKPVVGDGVTPARASELGVDGVFEVSHRITEALVDQFRAAGFRVWSRVDDREDQWVRLRSIGVGTIMTDTPIAYRLKFS